MLNFLKFEISMLNSANGHKFGKMLLYFLNWNDAKRSFCDLFWYIQSKKTTEKYCFTVYVTIFLPSWLKIEIFQNFLCLTMLNSLKITDAMLMVAKTQNFNAMLSYANSVLTKTTTLVQDSLNLQLFFTTC